MAKAASEGLDGPGENKEGNFTLVVLPDTQFYSERFPEIFTRQTEWIAERADALNINFVIHLGDLVEHGTSTTEWANATNSMSVLDGVVPYVMVMGNHDLDNHDDRLTSVASFNKYFPSGRYETELWYGGRKGDGNENSFALFTAGGMDFLILALEFAPTDETLTWANGVVSKHHDRRVIVVTHGYMYSDDTRIGSSSDHRWNPYYYRISEVTGGNSGEGIWQKFVRLHANIFLVLSGHILNDGTGRLTSTGDHGNVVHQLLSNYQEEPNGGDGWLRIMYFVPGSGEIQITTYSPYLDQFKTDPENMFGLFYE